MKNLLMKEIRLCLHPTNWLFLALSAMVLIPNYPLYITFFYPLLGVFFLCLTGREMRDLPYSLLLPIRKRDVVRGRMAVSVLLQMAQLALAAPLVLARNAAYAQSENLAGMDANLALLGLSAVMMGLFNLVFFPLHYKNPERVGAPFLWGSAAIFVFMLAAETCAHAVPYVRDVIDTPDPQHIGIKAAILAAGLALYAALTWLSYQKSARAFESVDL